MTMGILATAIYKGTVNDPTTFPPSSRSHGSYHWTFERLLSAGLVPLTAAAFVTSGSPTPLLDGLLGISLIVHSHIGVRLLFLYTPSLNCLLTLAGGYPV
jgi:succinate dehydrogenase (ubiquinone) membrane anchor subunit